jgi:hypothetical protein
MPGFCWWFAAIGDHRCEVVLPCHLEGDPVANLQPPAGGCGQQFAAAGPVGPLNLVEVGQQRSGWPVAQLVPRRVVVLRRLPVCGIAAADHEPGPGAATPGRAPRDRLRLRPRSRPARTGRAARWCPRHLAAQGRSGWHRRRSARRGSRYRGCARPPGRSARAAGRWRCRWRRAPRCYRPYTRNSTGTGRPPTGRNAAGTRCRATTNPAHTAVPRCPTARRGTSPTGRVAGPPPRRQQSRRCRIPA